MNAIGFEFCNVWVSFEILDPLFFRALGPAWTFGRGLRNCLRTAFSSMFYRLVRWVLRRRTNVGVVTFLMCL